MELETQKIADLDGAAAQKHGQFRTLVVDGNFFFGPFLEKFLESEGHLILNASSPEDALAKTRQFQPDLILLDDAMDGANGTDLLSGLLMEQASAAVILLARHPAISRAVDAITSGAMDYLGQPLDFQRLKLSIDAQTAFLRGQQALEN
jgi:DNA-binding NtrC family response regulator